MNITPGNSAKVGHSQVRAADCSCCLLYHIAWCLCDHRVASFLDGQLQSRYVLDMSHGGYFNSAYAPVCIVKCSSGISTLLTRISNILLRPIALLIRSHTRIVSDPHQDVSRLTPVNRNTQTTKISGNVLVKIAVKTVSMMLQHYTKVVHLCSLTIA